MFWLYARAVKFIEHKDEHSHTTVVANPLMIMTPLMIMKVPLGVLIAADMLHERRR